MSSSPILENLLYDKKGAIAFVTLNRPRVLNALNRQTWQELRTVFEDARDDPEIRGVILTGAGDKAFIAGADIGELAHVTAVEAEQSSSYGQAVLDLIENLGKPVIAAVNGYALGGGCETAMACTIRVAAEHAKFGQPEVTLDEGRRDLALTYAPFESGVLGRAVTLDEVLSGDASVYQREIDAALKLLPLAV